MTVKSLQVSNARGAPATQAELFFQREAPFWDDRSASRTYQQRRSLVLETVRRELSNTSKAPTEMAALDFGCGGGVLVEDLSRFGISVTGVDRSRAMIDVAQSRSHAAEFEWLSNRPGNYERRTYNLILCISVLEFVDDPGALLVHLTSLLSAGGLLVLTVPNQNSYLRTLEWFAYGHPKLSRWIPGISHLAQPDCYLRHQTQQFTSEALTNSANARGLKIEHRRFHVAPRFFGPMERLENVGMMLMLVLRKMHSCKARSSCCESKILDTNLP